MIDELEYMENRKKEYRMNQFKKDLLRGKAGEKLVADQLTAQGVTVVVNNDTNYRDLTCEYNGKRFTVEVKTDEMSERTGNLFLEIKAVNDCAADFVAYVSGENVFICPSSDLKTMVNRCIKEAVQVNQDKVGSLVEYYGIKLNIKYYVHPYWLALDEVLNHWIK